MSNTRKDASSVTINETFENEEIEIDSSYDYVSLADGQVLISKDYIAELEIDLGYDVRIFTRIQSDRNYIKAKNALLDVDDTMLTKYLKIDTAIQIYSVNLNPTVSGKTPEEKAAHEEMASAANEVLSTGPLSADINIRNDDIDIVKVSADLSGISFARVCFMTYVYICIQE